MKKAKEEWQYFILKNENTGEQKQLRVGPMPINALEIMGKMKKAHEEIGVPFKENSDWVIEKAWVGI